MRASGEDATVGDRQRSRQLLFDVLLLHAASDSVWRFCTQPAAQPGCAAHRALLANGSSLEVPMPTALITTRENDSNSDRARLFPLSHCFHPLRGALSPTSIILVPHTRCAGRATPHCGLPVLYRWQVQYFWPSMRSNQGKWSKTCLSVNHFQFLHAISHPHSACYAKTLSIPRLEASQNNQMASERILPQNFTFRNRFDIELACRYWCPTSHSSVDNIDAVVFIAHGFAEHCQVGYEELVDALIGTGTLIVAAHDHRGHGLSGGQPRGYLPSIEQCVDDVLQHCQLLRERLGDTTLPFYLFGHSMGGLIALLASLREPQSFRGMILQGPLIVPDPAAASPLQIGAARCLARLFPTLALIGMDLNDTCSDEEVLNRMRNDALYYLGRLRVQTAVSMLDSMAHVEKCFAEVSMPLLVLHGDADKTCSVDGSKKFVHLASSEDKTLIVFPAAKHRVHEEPSCKADAIAASRQWLLERAPTARRLAPPSDHRTPMKGGNESL